MMSQSEEISWAERRKHPRHETDTPFSLQVFLPEDTMQPEWLIGKSVNVSLEGMKVYLESFPTNLFHRLLRQLRQVRVIFESPLNGEEIDLTGHLVWVDYHKPTTSTTSGTCYLGIFFNNQESEFYRRYEQFVESI